MQSIAGFLARLARANAGRPPYTTVLMTRLLVLRQLFKLGVSAPRPHERGQRGSSAQAGPNVQVSEADTLHLVAVLDRGNSSRDFWADRGYHNKPREHWLSSTDGARTLA